MSTRWLLLTTCVLSISLGAMPSLAGPADAQTPVPAVPGGHGRLSPFTINHQFELGVAQLQKALDSLTSGTELPTDTAKVIYAGYVHIRAGHALLNRRITRRFEKTQVPEPTLDLAYATIKRARWKVLHAREAAAKSNPARSVELLTAAIPEIERASALIQ
jgi:hypothetical protein